MKLDQASECGSCGSKEPWVLHNVRHRGIYRRLCTSCVLKLHTGLFCPVCFEVYEASALLNNDRVMCLKCPSVSHKSCVNEGIHSNYVCPSCTNPSFVFFETPASNNKKSSSDGDGISLPARNQKAINVNSAKILVAASKIASISMNKAASVARVESERRVKEATFARKRAREALERFVSLGVKQKEKIVIPPPIPVVLEQKKKSKGNNSAVTAAVAAQKRIQNQYRAVGDDKSGTVPVALNNVKENERLVGLHAPKVVQRPSKKVASIENMDELRGSSSPVTQQLQNPDAVKEKTSGFLSQVVPVQKEKNGVVSASSVARRPPQNSHDIEEEREKSKAFADSGAGAHLIPSSQDTLVSKSTTETAPKGSSNSSS